jgi:amino acid transporter
MAIHGYLQALFDIPQVPAALLLIGLMSWVSFRGIRESSTVNIVFTAVEATGIGLVLVIGYHFVLGTGTSVLGQATLPAAGWGPVLAGATIAFYAFIGFEDLANLAEEAKNPSRDIPIAMVVSVSICTVLYMAVLFVVLAVMTPQEAAASPRPLLEVLTRAGFPMPPWGFSAIALFAIINTGLANLVMASRLMYGMAAEGLLPRVLTRVHERRRTPWVGVVAAMLLCATLVLSGGVTLMAQTTSLLLVLAFVCLHISLIVLRRRSPGAARFPVPQFVPWAGLVFCGLLLSQSPGEAYLRAGVIAAAAAVLYIPRWRNPMARG